MRAERDLETKRIEAQYLNNPDERDSENLEKLNKIAGKYRKEQDFGTIKSKMLEYVQESS